MKVSISKRGSLHHITKAWSVQIQLCFHFFQVDALVHSFSDRKQNVKLSLHCASGHNSQ